MFHSNDMPNNYEVIKIWLLKKLLSPSVFPEIEYSCVYVVTYCSSTKGLTVQK